MHASPESGLPNSFWKLLFLAAFLALFCLLPVISMGRGRDTLPLHPIPKTKPGRLHKSLDTPGKPRVWPLTGQFRFSITYNLLALLFRF